MRYQLTSIGVIALIAVCATSATASQQMPTEDRAAVTQLETLVEAKKEAQRSIKRQVQRDPRVRSGLTLPEPQLSLETQKGNGKATGTIGFVNTRPSGETSFLFALSSPIGDGDDAVATPLDLRGLGNGATINVSFGGASMFRSFVVDDIRKICGHLPKTECTAGKLEEKNKNLSDDLLATVFRRVPILYAASVTYGRNKYSYFNQTGEKDSVRLNDFEVEGTLAAMVNGRTNLLAFQVAYSDKHEASKDKTQLCRPLNASTVTRCDAAIMGAPTKERSAIGTIEYRIQWAGDRKVPIAIAPKLQFELGFDDAENLGAVEVPVFFFQEKADAESNSTAPKLNGGISAGWRSDNGFQVSVFIGTTFKLLKI